MTDLEKRRVELANRLKMRLAHKMGKSSMFTCLLLDVSASMDGSPIRELGLIAAKFTGVRRFIFSNDCEELAPGQYIGDAQEGTCMGEAFKYVRDKGIKHVILVTDGRPNDEQLALDESVDLKIDIFYVGPPPAPEFLYKLARHTGGKYGECSLFEQGKLEEGIKGLLPAPGDSPIQL
jgi:hypothetical protein